ncbi:MAG: glycosyltransferase family 39 protein [Chloroflexi bacterium]|nr:glycosyltransferase family 39 protein [Chloroflexota bacterium]
MPAISRREWIAVIGLLLIGAAFRLVALNDVPPGLHHDEVIIGQVAKDILRGNLAIYFTAGYGHEPLYHYLVAGFFVALGASAFALRLTSAFVAILGLAVAYRFTRRLFSPGVALGTLAWLSISLWPVFFARVGLRGITLPLLTMLTAYFLWRAVHATRTTNYVVAGALLGLSVYTYQASRVFPVIFAVFFIYLVVTRSSLVIAKHPSGTCHSSLVARLGTFFLAALLVAAPLIIYLTVINPTAEERVADLSGPLNELRAGNPGEVISSTLNTVGMFTIKGDAVPIYNVSERPVFPEPIGAALFYLGFLICLWRWKQPAYAFMLIWFVISLAPAMVTPFSPNFVRTMAVWPAPFVLAGLGMQWVGQRVNWLLGKLVNWWKGRSVNRSIGQLVNRSLGRPEVQSRRHLVTLSPGHLVKTVFALTIAFNAALTYRDYFLDWPRGDYVRFWQQAAWTQAVRAINADPSTAPVIASGLSIHDLDPQTFDLLGVRSDVEVKWADCRQAVLHPGGFEERVFRYLSPPYYDCDKDLRSTFLPGITTTLQPRWPDTQGVIFTLDRFNRPYTLAELVLPRVVTSTLYLGTESFDPISPTHDLVRHFGLGVPDFEGLSYYGNTPHPDVFMPGETLTFDTLWLVTRPISPPLKIFIHLTTPDGKIAAQWDGLDVNVGTLETGDEFIQRHRLTLPADLPPGPYRVSLGVYHPGSGQRLVAQLADRTLDSVVLTMIDVK